LDHFYVSLFESGIYLSCISLVIIDIVVYGVKFIYLLTYICIWVKQDMWEEMEAKGATKRTITKEDLKKAIYEILAMYPDQEIEVRHFVLEMGVDGKRIRKVLREMRAKDPRIKWVKKGNQVVYIYSPSQQETVEENRTSSEDTAEDNAGDQIILDIADQPFVEQSETNGDQ